jgi:2-polyprenyl-6-methoxyphenol hydroxylase-like FAD-dependent oxidoreductase
MIQTQALIVGAGPAGAALALLLASRGVETLLLERQQDFEREFRGEVVMPSGLAVLEALGVDLSAVPHRQPTRLLGYRGNQRFLDLALSSLVGARSPMSISQPHLLEHLVEQASRQKNFKFMRGGIVRDLLDVDGRLCGVSARTREGERELRGQIVIGADGRASIVRRRGGFRVDDRGAPMDIVWFKLPWPEAWREPEVRAYIGGGHLLAALPAPDGLLQLAWVIMKGSYGSLRGRGITGWAQAMIEHVDAELGDHIAKHVADISRPFLLDSVTDRVRGWTRPGALLIGDAAHTMSPVGGQGLNLALRDAVVVANHLVPAFRSGASDEQIDAAAAAVETERAPEIDRIQRLAALPPRLMMGRRFYHESLRRLFALLLRTPPGRSLAAPIADAFLHGVTGVELHV